MHLENLPMHYTENFLERQKLRFSSLFIGKKMIILIFLLKTLIVGNKYPLIMGNTTMYVLEQK